MKKTPPNFACGTVVKHLSLLLLTVVWLGLTTLNLAFAQGTAFTYQGRLNDGANPANGSYDLRFALFDALTIGNQLASPITNSPVNVSNGLFTVTLDFGNQFPGPDRWLEIGVRTNEGGAFTSLNPRQPLTPAPYAIYSSSAATLATTNSQPLNLTINGTNVLRIESVYDSTYSSSTVNSVGGYSGNVISNGFVGSFIGGGGNSFEPNRVGGDYASVLGGLGNTASGFASTAIGYNTTASGNFSTTMGYGATASGFVSTAIGWLTTASGPNSTAMGYACTATNDSCTAIGDACRATGLASTAIGFGNTASGDLSTAMGSYSTARFGGTFVWADSTEVEFDPFSLPGPQGIPNSFNVRSTGGFFIASAVNPVSGQITAGVQLTAGSGTWGSYSDRNAKTNFSAVDTRAVLEKLAQIPLETWNYKAQAASIRHIGPMAQDFAAAFAVGDDDMHITTVDADGVALAAIQGLNQKLEQKLEQKETELAELKTRLEKLERLFLSSSTKGN
jgi:hypothetical protein